MIGEDYRSCAMQLMERVEQVNQTLRSREETICSQVDLINRLEARLEKTLQQNEQRCMLIEDLWQENIKQISTAESLNARLQQS